MGREGENVTFQSGPDRIQGYLARPEGPGRFPALVVVTLGPPGSLIGDLRIRRALRAAQQRAQAIDLLAQRVLVEPPCPVQLADHRAAAHREDPVAVREQLPGFGRGEQDRPAARGEVAGD